MREAGCKLLVYPGAFNTTTGPAHWELLQRGRAVDNQCYVATASPARNPESGYQASATIIAAAAARLCIDTSTLANYAERNI